MGYLKKKNLPYQFKEGHEKEIINRLERYCAYTERCEMEVVNKMKGWKVPEELFSETLNYLKENQFIHASRYGQLYANGKFKIKSWGKIKIRAALQSKQIEEEIITSSIEGIEEDKYIERLNQLLTHKYSSFKGQDNYTMRNKLYRYAVQKGYEPQLVLQWINSHFSQE
ncbi:MAG: RecX family transcriptional regulator [Chitinophagales bacterium]|nr:RecX family transcriptional regulator [Chitinophagales bacterium]MCZ2393923.1 RecX family transcriptional regulator [Chitinophagales bacterium]